MTDLGTLGGPNSCAYSINDRGRATGVAQDDGNEWHAVIWYRGSVTDLGVIAPASTTLSTFFPLSPGYFPRQVINQLGAVAGSFNPSPNIYGWHAFYWKGGAFTDLGTFGMPAPHIAYSYAAGLNSLGRVVGNSSYPGGTLDPPYEESRGFSWKPGGTMNALVPLAGYEFSKTYAVNDLGLAVGGSYDSYSYPSGPLGRATAWWSTSILDLGTLGGDYSLALGINSRNDVIGISTTDEADERHAFLKSVPLTNFFRGLRRFLPFRPMQDLGTLGGDRSYPNDLNYSRQVVGFSSAPLTATPAPVFVDHAFLWEGGFMTDLTPEEGKSEAIAINASGQVVGYLYPHVE